MKESKAVYVTKRDIRENILHREYQLYANNIIHSIDVKQHRLTNDVGIQYNSRRDNAYYTHRNVSNSRKYNDYDLRYFSGTPKQIYTYQRSRSFTDIGVGSVKALQKKKVKRIYLPETDDRGVGSSDLSSFVNRTQPSQNKSKTKHYRVFQSYYETKRTSSKCVGGAIDTQPECLVSAKVSPICHTRSATTSSMAVVSREKPTECKENKEIETGSCHIRQNELVSTETQFEEIEEDAPVVRTPEPLIEETKSPTFILLDKPSEPKVIESLEKKSEPKIEVITTKTAATAEPLKGSSSSDSLVQHVHNLEQPSEYSKQPDPMENKMEREYRKMFASISKENEKSENVAESKNMPQKSTSLFRRRFTAIRKSLGKKDSKNNMDQEKGSVPSVRDASITSDPPSLEERSLSSINGYRHHEHKKKQRKPSYKKSYTGNKASKTWSKANPVDSEYAQGVKGMFKLWGKKFNLEDSTDNKEDTTQPSSIENKRFDRGEEIVKNIVEAEEEIEEEKKPEKEMKKETKKFFFFKKKHSKDKSKNESPPYKSKKGVTTGRCEVKDGLSIRMGTARTAPTRAAPTAKKQKPIPLENYEDLKRAAWLMKYLSNPKESRNSVKIRWNNKTYATSSSTIFELYKNVYKSTGVVLKSKSEITTEPSSSWNNRKASYVQKIQAYMIPTTILDCPPPIVLLNRSENPVISKMTKSKSLNQNKQHQRKQQKTSSMELSISDQKWFIEKSKAFAHKIEVVLHSKNFVKLKNPESEYLRIDIPKGFFTDSSSDEHQHGHGHSSDEEVYNIVEYESLNCKPGYKQARIKSRAANSKDQNLESESVQVTISVKSGLDEESKILETVIKRPAVHRDVVIQGSNVYIPKKCDVIGVGIITQRDVRETGQPVLKFMEYLSDESEHSLPKTCPRNSEFAETCLQDYYRQWQPLGLDMFSWCYSDSHLECCSEHNSKDSLNLNSGDAAKSCPNIYKEYMTMVSSYSSSCCIKPNAQLPCNLNDILSKKQIKKENEKKKKEDKKKKNGDNINNGPYRVLPKDSLEVFKKRKVYALEKLNWISDKMEPYSVPSNAETGIQSGKRVGLICRSQKPQGILTYAKDGTSTKKILKISSNTACTIPNPGCCVSSSCPPEGAETCKQQRDPKMKSKCPNQEPPPDPLPPALKVPIAEPPLKEIKETCHQPHCQGLHSSKETSSPTLVKFSDLPSPPRSHKDCPYSCCQQSPNTLSSSPPKGHIDCPHSCCQKIPGSSTPRGHIDCPHSCCQKDPGSSPPRAHIDYPHSCCQKNPGSSPPRAHIDYPHSCCQKNPGSSPPRGHIDCPHSCCQKSPGSSPPRGHIDCPHSCCQKLPGKSQPNGVTSPLKGLPCTPCGPSSHNKKSPVHSQASPNRCKTMYPRQVSPDQRPASPPQRHDLMTRPDACQQQGSHKNPQTPASDPCSQCHSLHNITSWQNECNATSDSLPSSNEEDIIAPEIYNELYGQQHQLHNQCEKRNPEEEPLEMFHCPPPPCPPKPLNITPPASPPKCPTGFKLSNPPGPPLSPTSPPICPPKFPLSPPTPPPCPPIPPLSPLPPLCPPEPPLSPSPLPCPPDPPLSPPTPPPCPPKPPLSPSPPPCPPDPPLSPPTPPPCPPKPPLSPSPPPCPPEHRHPPPTPPPCRPKPPLSPSPPPCPPKPPLSPPTPPPCPPKPLLSPPKPPPCPPKPLKICPPTPPPKCPMGFKLSNTDCIKFPKPRPIPGPGSIPSSPESISKFVPCPPDCRTRPRCLPFPNPPPDKAIPKAICPSPPKTPPKSAPPKSKSPPKSPCPPPKANSPSSPKTLPECSCPSSPKTLPECPPPKATNCSRCPKCASPPESPFAPKAPTKCEYSEPKKSYEDDPAPCCNKRCKKKNPLPSRKYNTVASLTSIISSHCTSTSSHQNKEENKDCVCTGDSVTGVTRTHSAPSKRPVDDCSKPLDSGPKSQPNMGKFAKFTGILFRKFPKHDSSKSGVIKINSSEEITFKLKEDDKASTRGLKDEDGFMKICDEDGNILVERKDYSSVKQTVPLINKLYNESEMNRVTAPITVNEVASVERENKLKESKSTDSIVNVIEINFKLRVIQGDKTTEVNIASEDGNVPTDAATPVGEPNLKQKSCKKNMENFDRDKEVYIVKDENAAEDINSKNDLNIRILIKNYKPKIDSLKERKAVNKFSNKISKKFNTVSTGYNVDTEDVGSPDQCFSIHRATIDLTTSEKSKVMTPPKENVILKKSEVRFTENTKIVSETRLSHSVADTTSKGYSYSRTYGSRITSATDLSEPARLTTKSLPLLRKKVKSGSLSTTMRKSSLSSDPSAFLESYDGTSSKTAENLSSKSLQKSSRTMHKTSRSDDGYTTIDKTEFIGQKLSRKSLEVKDIYKSKAQTSFADAYDCDLSIGNKTSDEPTDLLTKTSEDPTEATEPLTKSSEDRTYDAKTSEDQLLSDTKNSDIKLKVVKVSSDDMNYLNTGKTKKEEKKEILKQVFDKSSFLRKPKKKNRMQKLKDMLKALLTSDDTDSETSIAVTENELTKEIRKCCQPMMIRTSDSLNNFLDTKSLEVSKTVSDVKPLCTSVADLAQVLSDESGNSENDVKPENKVCMCNDFAKKLNLQNIFGGGGGCCCAKTKPQQISQQISCNIYQEVSLEDYGFFAPSVECIHCQTNNSRYKSSIHCAKVISISSKRTSFITPPTPEPIEKPETPSIAPLSSDHFSDSKRQLSSRQSHFGDTSVEKTTEQDVAEKKDTVCLEKQATTISNKGEIKKKKKHHTKSMNQADVLQLYETKKAVLEIYAEKTVTDDGEHIVAKLPKYVRDTESQLYQSYDKLGQKSYKSVYKRNFVMMCIGR